MPRSRSRSTALALAAAWAFLGAAPAHASDDRLRSAAQAELAALERAAAAGLGSAAFAQAQYDAARRLEGAVPRLAFVSRPCRPLGRALLEYAAGIVAAAEGVDRLDPRRVAAGRRRADGARRRVDSTRPACRTGGPTGGRLPHIISEPRSGAAFFGDVAGPHRGDEARLFVNGALEATARTGGATVRFRLRRPPGRYSLEIRSLRGGRVLRRAFSRHAYLLPSSAQQVRPVRATDARLAAELDALGRSFSGYAAVAVHDLATGRVAGWNEDARFPAASTVKLAVLVEALRRWAPYRHDLRIEAELSAMVGWSSNLATNRLLTLLGDGSELAGAGRAAAALRRMGATRSTFPQGYRVGTAVGEPPLVSGRVTTARDLARVLRLIHASAVGNRAAQRRTGLSAGAARYALGLLLQWERRGANIGVLAGALPTQTPIAQKNGWISDARHTAAIVYAQGGPKLVVLLTYRDGLGFADAAALGRRLLRAVF